MNLLSQAVATAAFVLTASTGFAANISLFYDGTYGDTGRENKSQRADLVDSGNTVTDFSGVSDAAWAAALTGVDALVIPELERRDVAGDLSAATLGAVNDYVSDGGNLVVTNAFGNALKFLNAVFGTTFADRSEVNGTSDLVAGGPANFAAGPATLNRKFSIDGLELAKLGGATSVYERNGVSSVFSFAVGSGNVTFIGYDWFGGQDAGWAKVQHTAANIGVAAPAVPLPAPALMLLTGLGGLAALRRRAS